MIHVNSLLTYQQEVAKFNQRESLIYGHLIISGRAMTDREIKEGLFGVTSDQNKARPRITELKKRGWLVEVGKVKDKVTGKSVRRVRALSAEERWQAAQEPAQQMELI